MRVEKLIDELRKIPARSEVGVDMNGWSVFTEIKIVRVKTAKKKILLGQRPYTDRAKEYVYSIAGEDQWIDRGPELETRQCASDDCDNEFHTVNQRKRFCCKACADKSNRQHRRWNT
jgi:hypothetical protein